VLIFSFAFPRGGGRTSRTWVWRGQARIIVEVEARACPLRQLQDDASIATAQAACHAPASEAVTAVTGYSSSTHHFLDGGRSVK